MTSKSIYKNADKKILDRIEMSRPCVDGKMSSWWQVGNAFCTQGKDGYYYLYVIEYNSVERVLHKYYLNSKGKLTDKGKFYSIPTKADLIAWCAERGIETNCNT